MSLITIQGYGRNGMNIQIAGFDTKLLDRFISGLKRYYRLLNKEDTNFNRIKYNSKSYIEEIYCMFNIINIVQLITFR